MPFPTAKTYAFGLLLALTGCVSSADFEHLERQDQLHQLEATNLQKRVDMLAAELEKQRSSAADLERQLAAANQTVIDKDGALADLDAKLRAKSADVSILEGKLAKVRAALNDSSLAHAPARKALLLDLLPLVPPQPIEPEGAAAAASTADPERAVVTH